ncbi:uncharacterized protein LOC141875337 isoform X1 [Acropora palmata]|uniref:uncharacterized protein LOC141875337 isoform X1 n=1 Tax=Acropora palmata TaxID=6131 RepID=UPI003D9FDBBE
MASNSSTTSSNMDRNQEKLEIDDRESRFTTFQTGVSPRNARRTAKEESFRASDLFCQKMSAMINRDDVQSLLDKQADTLTKFEKTNAKFSRLNDLSATRYSYLQQQLRSHTKMLLDMKKDLDSVFRRIRNLKTKLAKQYGPAFHATSGSIQKLEEGIGASMENDDEVATSLNTLTDVGQELNSDRRLENQDNEVINTNKEDDQLNTADKINSFSHHCISEGADKAINTHKDRVDEQLKTEDEINNFGEYCIADGGTTGSHSNGHSVETSISQGSHILLPGNQDNEETVSRTQGIGTEKYKRTLGTITNKGLFREDSCETLEEEKIS